MEIINISEEQKNRLCSHLVDLVTELKKDEAVECIYMAPYLNLGEIRGKVFKITIVVKDGLEYEKEIKYGSEAKRACKYEEESRDFGVKLYVSVDSSSFYTTVSLNPSELLRDNKLFNSAIIFDRTGEYTRIKKLVDEEGERENYLYYYKNLSQIEPPIIDDVKHMIEEKQIEEETKAVKQSTKTKLFEQYKKI